MAHSRPARSVAIKGIQQNNGHSRRGQLAGAAGALALTPNLETCGSVHGFAGRKNCSQFTATTLPGFPLAKLKTIPIAVDIRTYTQADWPHVCRVHDLARVQELANGGVDAGAFRPMTEAAEGDEFFVSETLVACIGEAVIGFVSWNGDLITWLYVDPAQQRRGIGRLLLGAAIGRIGPEAWTGMLANNAPALALYLQAGLEVVFTRPSKVEGYPCGAVRLALPTSRMRDPAVRRQAT
jgi:GNAT superfamily N-acetyltransferase